MTKNRFRWALFSVVLVSVVSCTSVIASPIATPTTTAMATPTTTPTAPSQDQDLLTNTNWVLVSLGAVNSTMPAITGTTLTLTFGPGNQVSGQGGCNSFGGQYAVNGDTLTISELVSTLRACTDEQLMQQETQYLEALRSAERFSVADDQLMIWYNGGQRVLNFERGTAAGPRSP